MKLAIVIIPLVLASIAFFSLKAGGLGIVKPRAVDVQEKISFYANKFNLELALVKAIARIESNFNPLARNYEKSSSEHDDSIGLMQISPALAQDYGLVRDYMNVTDLEIQKMFDIDNNLFVSCSYLKLMSKYPFDQMVQSYNVGDYGYRILGRRNSSYLESVRGYYEKY